MPRYYFNVRDGETISEDVDGIELQDLEAARREAIVAARDIMIDQLRGGEQVDGQIFEIENEDGEVLLVIPVRDALKPS
ncbi:MAG: hypothetical protein JWM58_115 [Rhizobium sp.]|nr:hypothetical protein [Rhizobium sp.]